LIFPHSTPLEKRCLIKANSLFTVTAWTFSFQFPFFNFPRRNILNVFSFKFSVKVSHHVKIANISRFFLVGLRPLKILFSKLMKLDRVRFLPNVKILVFYNLRFLLGYDLLCILPGWPNGFPDPLTDPQPFFFD